MKVTLRRDEARPNPSALPAFAMFLMVSAAAIAQPLAKPRQPDVLVPAPIVRAATVRVALPPPVALTPAKSQQTGTVRLLLRDLGPVEPAAPPPAALVASTAAAPEPLSPAPIALPDSAVTGSPESADLVRNGSRDLDAFSATMSAITDSLTTASDPKLARRARSGPIDDLAASAGVSAGAGAGATTPAQALAAASTGSRPDPLASPRERLQMILNEPSTPKKRTIASVSLKVSATVNGGAVGRVSLLIDDAENIQVRLSELLTMLQPAIEPGLYARLSESEAAQSYMTLNDLRAAGIKVRFDAHDRLVITTPEK